MTNKNNKSTHLEKTDLPQKTDLKKLTGLQELKLEDLDVVEGGWFRAPIAPGRPLYSWLWL